jgi:hypothetical protein
MTIWGKEPAIIIGTIVTIIVAVITTLSGNGFISEAVAGKAVDAVNAIQQLILALLPLITAVLVRQQVYAPATVEKVAAQAARTGSPTVTVGPP